VTAPKTKRLRPESYRPTQQLKLRPSLSAVEKFRQDAKRGRRKLSQYFEVLVGRGERVKPEHPAELDALGDVLRKILAIPAAVRELDSDLGKMNGRLKSLFELDPGKAYAHQDEINATLFAVRDLRNAIMLALAEIESEVAESRDALARALQASSGKRDA
jgi:hypothetical protein